MESTQDFLEFDQIKDGVIVLKNKGLRIVLMVSSLNFALKSDDEQSAILYQFQNFLNSLDFSCQILVQSRRLNITGYLNKLEEIEEKETNELLQMQIKEYRKFIKQITTGGIIMHKTFYVIIPFSIIETQITQGGGNPLKISALTEEIFQRAKAQLLQRAEFTALGLRACGLQAIPLNNTELIELFWALHHQEEAEQGYYPEFPEDLK